MGRDEARALAAKREAHKSPGVLKRWQAVEVNGDWKVALLDDDREIERRSLVDARNAFLSGDLSAFLDAASSSLMAKVRIELASHQGDPA